MTVLFSSSVYVIEDMEIGMGKRSYTDNIVHVCWISS